MFPFRMRVVLALAVVFALALMLVGPSVPVRAAGNVLANASFEEGSYVFNNDGDQRVPNGWQPWWNGSKSGCSNSKPHYELETHPSHVADGSASARYYTGYSTHDGGLMQQVAVTKGVRYRFTISGFAWSSDNPVVDTPSTSSSHMMVGIDPAGGRDPFAPSVVWSPQRSEMDQYVQMSVEAVTSGTSVTVFTRTQPDWCVARNDSFWDAASLTQTTGTVVPTQPPATSAPAPTGPVTAIANLLLNIRSGPSINNEIIAYLPKGATATVLGRDSGTNWIYIQYNNIKGWIAGWLCTINGDVTSLPVVDVAGVPVQPGTGTSPVGPSSPPTGSVMATPRLTLNMRAGPGVTYAPVSYVPGGVAVPVLGKDSTGTWLYVERSGMRGWIAGWLCDISGDLNTVQVVTASGGPVNTPTTPSPGTTVPSPTGVSATTNLPLNIRSGPGTTYQIIGTLQTNVTVPVIGKSSNSGWLQIDYNGTKGWIAGWLCTVQGDLQNVPATGKTPSALKVQYRPAQQTGVTAVANVNITIRDYPSLTSNKVGTLPIGVTVDVVGRTADTNWFFINYNGISGWIARWLTHYQGYLADVPVLDPSAQPTPPPSLPPPTQPSGNVMASANSGINIRSGPSTSYAALGALPAGTLVPVLGKTSGSDWLYVDYNGTKGWVAAWLCTVSGDLSQVPVTAQSVSTPPPGPTSGSSGFSLGGQVPGFIGHPDLMRSAHMTWVKSQVVWYPGMSPTETSGSISDAHAQGFKILLSVKGPLYPSGIDYASYASFVGGVAGLGADAIEVWNEMNLDREWPAGQISPSDYVTRMLGPAYQQIKAANPSTLVITGAPAPTGAHNGVTVWSDDIYVAGMRDAGAANYADCIGVHYNAGATSPDVSVGHPADDGAHHYSWYFKPTFDLYAAAFPGKKLCFTELGYLSPEGYPPLSLNFWWGYGTTTQEQADWLARAASLARSSGRVRLVVVFNVDFYVYDDDPQAGYAILRVDGKCPACSKLAAVVP